MKILKKILKFVFGISTFLFMLFTFAGFYFNWKTGVIWFLSTILLFVLFGSFLENKDTTNSPKVSNPLRIVLFVLFIISFGWGATFLPKEFKNKKDEVNKETLKESVQKEDSKPVIDISKLKGFQKNWVDSVVSSESKVGNRHLVDSKLILPDTIYFEYTEGVTKNGFDVNIQNDTVLYRTSYKKSIMSKLGTGYASYPVHITCIPNQNVDYQKIVQENQIKAKRKEKIQMQFSAWNGSHDGLKRLVKESMHDPSSFDHTETVYVDKGKYILVQMKYRGKNSFGAMVLNMVTAKVDLDGNILSVQ